MLKDQIALLYEFDQAGVEYVVIGGHAVNAFCVPRMTKDLDVLIRASEADSERVLVMLAAFGALLQGVSAADFRDGKSIFQLGVEPSRVDVLQTIPAVDFERAWRNRISGLLEDGMPAWFICREDLIANKLETGRPQDLADVDHLRRAAKSQG